MTPTSCPGMFAFPSSKKTPLTNLREPDSYILTVHSVSASTHYSTYDVRMETNHWRLAAHELCDVSGSVRAGNSRSGREHYVIWQATVLSFFSLPRWAEHNTFDEEETKTLLISWPTYNSTSVSPLGFAVMQPLSLVQVRCWCCKHDRNGTPRRQQGTTRDGATVCCSAWTSSPSSWCSREIKGGEITISALYITVISSKGLCCNVRHQHLSSGQSSGQSAYSESARFSSCQVVQTPLVIHSKWVLDVGFSHMYET